VTNDFEGKRGLPMGWSRATLEEIAEINPSLPANDTADETEVSFLPMKAVAEESGKFDSSVTRSFGQVKKGYTPFVDGDVIFAKITPCMENGKSAVVRKLMNGVGLGSTEFHVLRPESGLISEFLFFYLIQKSFRQEAQSKMTGSAGQKRVPTAFIERSEIHLPSTTEQRRIVSRIEELFTRLDAGVEELRKAQTQLRRYRQSVLNAAITGKLTKEWREAHQSELESASELLARILKKRREKWETDQLTKMEAAGKAPKGDVWKANYPEPQPPTLDGMPELPKEWSWARLDSLAAIKGGITKNAGRRIRNGRTIPYLRVANVQRGYFDLAEMKLIEATEAEISELQLQNEDVLFTEGGDRDKLGRGWVWHNELQECIHQNHIFRGRLFSPEMSARFISLFSNTFGINYFLREGKQTTNLASINHTKLSGLPVPVPSSEEQGRIVEEIERCFSIADASERTIEQSLKQAERLRQSILKQAFEGKLVPQDPKDELADLLLERIKIERAQREAEKRAGSKPNRGGFRKKQNKRVQRVTA